MNVRDQSIYRPASKLSKSTQCSAKKLRRIHGFTLVELLAVLTVLGVLIAVAQPWLAEMKASFDRKNARQGFEVDLRRARAQALSKGVRVIISLAPDAKSYTVGSDVLPYDTVSGNYDTVLFVTNLPEHVTLGFSGAGTDATKLIFTSRGFLSDIAGNRNTSQKIATLSYQGVSFATATVYPVGVASFTY